MTPAKRTTAKPGTARKPSSARLDARMSAAAKARLQAAADLAGVSLTDFVLQACDRAAERVFRAKGVLYLSKAGQEKFVDLILNPPAPNAKLLAAVRRYRAAGQGGW